MKRRTILQLAAAPAAAAGGTGRLAGHRNLYNGDCNFFFYNPELWQPEGRPYTAKAIHRFVDLLASSGIDTLVVNPNTQVVWYPSRKLEYALEGYRPGDRAFARPHAVGMGLSPQQVEQSINVLVEIFDLYVDLTDAKVDWLAECAKACRQRRLSPWLSYRMNDTHGSGAPDSPVNCKLFRNPKYRLSGRVPGSRGETHPGWVGLDYGYAEVRAYMLEMMREGVESYDYEGLEMDWLRHPVCLEPPASPRQTSVMTGWFADVKALAAGRKKPYPVGLRVPGSLGYLQSIGIDLKALVSRGLVDFVTFSNFWQTAWDMPHDELRRQLGPDVTIFGGMEDAPNWLETHAPNLTGRSWYQELQLAGDDAYTAKKGADGSTRSRGTRYLTCSAEFLRANAAGKLVLGADGIEQFNFFVTDQVRVPGQRANYGALRNLQDLEFLRGKPKHYALNTPSLRPNMIWDVVEPLPVRLRPKQRYGFRIPMCAEPAGLRLVVQVVTERLPARPDLGVSINGAWPVFDCLETGDLLFPAGPYRQHTEDHAAYNFTFEATAIREGWNEVALYNHAPTEVTVVSLELGVMQTGG